MPRAKKEIKIIKNKVRGKYGSYNQMNGYYRAFKKSKGEIIFLLDSDDFFKKNKNRRSRYIIYAKNMRGIKGFSSKFIS